MEVVWGRARKVKEKGRNLGRISRIIENEQSFEQALNMITGYIPEKQDKFSDD